MNFNEPVIDYAGISPIIALTVGICVVLLSAVFKPTKRLAPGLTLLTLASAAGLLIWQWGESKSLITGALRLDDLAISISLIAILTAAACVLFSLRERAVEEAGSGEYHALLLGSVLGMVLLAQAQNLVTFFVALETLSIPLYILCATNLRREGSLESGLKYLIVGSVGSATLLYGMAFLYGGTGSTGFEGIAIGIAHHGLLGDPLILIGIAMCAVGLAFKTSIAPFHQWTPDVYQGAPTPITSFMAVATKAAAFAVFVRFCDVALGPQVEDWQPALAVLAAISIVVGNVGALGQDSLKRLLGYSGIAQAGYMLGGIVVASEAGVSSLVFYLAGYATMNLAAFAVIVARERETPGLAADDLDAGLGRTAGDRRLHRQALPDRGPGRRRLHLAGGLHRHRHDDLARLLPEGGGGDVDAQRRGGRARRHPGDRRRRARSRPGRPRGLAPLVPDWSRATGRRHDRLLRRDPAAAGRVRRPRRLLAVLSRPPPPRPRP
jgi:NADH-quinone oxidoreductase subunit N